MSDTRKLRLTDKLGYLNTEDLAPIGGCNFLCLSDRQVAIIRGFVYPFARWPTRTVLPIDGYRYMTDPDIFAELIPELDDLELQISGGSTMSCQTIADAIAALAAAIAEAGAGDPDICQTNVYCGDGAIGGVAGQLATLTNEELLGPGAPDYPTKPDPPEGFETWEEYQTYKCQAAHYIWGQMRALAVANQLLAGFQVTAAMVAPVVAGLLGAFPVAFTPASFVVLVGAMVAVGVVSSYAFIAFEQWITYWDDHKTEIICGLYWSGAGADAVTLLKEISEAAILAITWEGVLAGLQGATAPLMGTILGDVIDIPMVSPLFQLVVQISVPYADCTACADPGIVCLTGQEVPFNSLIIGDGVSGWTDDNETNGYYVPKDGNGYITFTPTVNTTHVRIRGEYEHYQTGWHVVEWHVAGVNMGIPSSIPGWREVDVTKPCVMTADVQYSFRAESMGGNATWNRKIKIESVVS
ncbi:unnamed protein product [marine sediment metagenome]|uniref:Uncharacterized protein n=2 Tax=marine sediment metagenome TaxID=412755 RepID=X1LB22_9ZZZZ